MVTFPQVNKPLKLTISDSALLSWFKSSHRISVCPNCGRRARIRRNIAICGYCKARWSAGDIQDLIAELEVNNAPVGLDASSRVTARAKEPSLSSVPGLTVFQMPSSIAPPDGSSALPPGGAFLNNPVVKALKGK